METKQIGKFTIVNRNDWSDEFVLSEDDYRKCNFTENDRWLDVGGNIGAFGLKYHDRVELIASYEPDLSNYETLVENYRLNEITNAVAYPFALVGNDDEIRVLYVNKKKNKGMHSLVPVRGRDKVEIQCYSFNKALVENQINKIKLDCEGSEYELLMACDHLDQIDELIMEWHISLLKDNNGSKLQEVTEKLEAHNLKTQIVKQGFAWGNLVNLIIHATKN
jgi:FkbM family methyltransferase